MHLVYISLIINLDVFTEVLINDSAHKAKKEYVNLQTYITNGLYVASVELPFMVMASSIK